MPVGSEILRVRTLDELLRSRARAVEPGAVSTVRRIVDEVREEGDAALERWAVEFAELEEGDPLFFDRKTILNALERVGPETRERFSAVAARIRRFAEVQRMSVWDGDVDIPGGMAGFRFAPVTRAGCYAPGGRYPLPSSVLMTVIPAVVAGVGEIWVASPRPSTTTLAAAAAAGATGVIAAGGAHAIAALAYGAGPMPPCDVVVGPGNVYVTAAKHLVSERVAIDMLAGPSELVVVADATARPDLVAADLLAQAEHDPQAVPVLVATERSIADAVGAELTRQLETLPTAAVARAALGNGGCVLVSHVDDAIHVCNAFAPEHLELHIEGADTVQHRFLNYGSIFVGAHAAEALGDYGAGPNHVLPTGGTARSASGLSVLTFLRSQTWLRIDNEAKAGAMVDDAVWFARLEGLEAHARSAERRR